MRKTLDTLLSVEQRRGLIMFAFTVLFVIIGALSGVVIWLYNTNEKSQARERVCREEVNALHQQYGRQIIWIMERQNELREQIEQLPTRTKKKK